jgi:antitoxin (DNA-binding transcriptional repressor) of toxin-antitoxin stability system
MAKRPAKSPNYVSATDAAKNFGALVNRVREARVEYVVERKGHPIVRVSPVAARGCTVAELAAWLRARRELPGEYLEAVRDHVKTVNRPRVPDARWRS